MENVALHCIAIWLSKLSLFSQMLLSVFRSSDSLINSLNMNKYKQINVQHRFRISGGDHD